MSLAFVNRLFFFFLLSTPPFLLLSFFRLSFVKTFYLNFLLLFCCLFHSWIHFIFLFLLFSLPSPLSRSFLHLLFSSFPSLFRSKILCLSVLLSSFFQFSSNSHPFPLFLFFHGVPPFLISSLFVNIPLFCSLLPLLTFFPYLAFVDMPFFPLSLLPSSSSPFPSEKENKRKKWKLIILLPHPFQLFRNTKAERRKNEEKERQLRRKRKETKKWKEKRITIKR